MPPPCFQRPWHSNSWVGAPFWDILRAMPTRPLCPLKNSQLASPAAFVITPSPARGCPYRNRADGGRTGSGESHDADVSGQAERPRGIGRQV